MKSVMKTEFCNIAKVSGKIWLAKEEEVGGPRLSLLPPEELKADMSAREIGVMVVNALDSFFNAGRKLSPLDWEAYESEAAAFYSVRNSKALRSKIVNFTIRRTSPEICFFNGKTGINFLTTTYVDEITLGLQVIDAIKGVFGAFRHAAGPR